MNKAPAKQTTRKARAANAPQNPSVKAPAPKPAETAPEAEKTVDVPLAKAAADAGKDVGKKAENILQNAIKALDSATNSLVSSLGLQDFPKVPTTDADKRRAILIIYALYAASLFTAGLTAVFAYLLYVRKLKTSIKSSVWESHLVWLERTFLFSLVILVVGIFFPFGWLVSVAAMVYLLYRTVKGYIRYDESKAIEAPLAYY